MPNGTPHPCTSLNGLAKSLQDSILRHRSIGHLELPIPGLGFALVLALPGTFTAVIWSLVVRRAGWPGTWLSWALVFLRLRPLAFLGVVVSAAAELYVALAWTVLIIRATTHHMAPVHGAGKWIAWGIAFVVSCVPVLVGVLDWGRDPVKAVQHAGARIVAPLVPVGFLVLTYHPEWIRQFWGWVPRL